MDDVAIRAERLDDIGAITRVVAAAFKSPLEARLVDAIRASPNFVPEWSLVAEVDGRVVGHVMVSFVGLRDEAKERRVCSLAPLAVAPDFHGRGIGSALVRAVTATVDAAGEPFVVLEGSPVFYGRVGFEHALPHGIRIDLPEWAPPEAAQVMRLASYDPSIRGKIVYPPAFDDVTPEH
jgi:putative acetyltransferase